VTRGVTRSTTSAGPSKVACRKWGSLVLMPLCLTACASLLPKANIDSQAPWRTYAEAESLYQKIIPSQTRAADLRSVKIDADTPNVTLLNHVDLLRRFSTSSAIGAETLDEKLRACLAARHRCTAYELEETHTERKRVGNFWLDFFNFQKQVDVSGWRFNALIVMQDDLVVYKLWTGKPNIHELENERNPLGPLQGVGDSLVRRGL
jgi:hypothetical protein